MILLAAIVLSGSQQAKWPVASPDNGVSYYLAAAHLADSPEWKEFRSGRPSKKNLDVLRREASHAGEILDDLKKGNALPVYDPVRVETMLTIHPEYAAFKKISRIACDVAYIKAADGDLETASRWLVQADRFSSRLPATIFFGLLVSQSMVSLLRNTTRELLPRFKGPQLKEQIRELEAIANHPPDIEATAQSELQALNRSISLTVDDPTSLGLRDDPPDPAKAFDKILDFEKLSPELMKVLAKIMSAAPPEVQKDASAVSALKYLTAAEAQVPAASQAEYRKFLEILKAVDKPATYNLSDYAKRLDPASKTHAALVIRLACDPPQLALIAAFRRPERTWWKAWHDPPDDRLNTQLMDDGRHLRFEKLDIFALQLSKVLHELSFFDADDSTTRWSRSELLFREKARLAVVDAKIWAYHAAHHRLPSSLKAIGRPIDPLSRRPYEYRKTSATTYELAAVGVPGVGRIEAETKLPPAKSA